jgi:hypothetical protein
MRDQSPPAPKAVSVRGAGMPAFVKYALVAIVFAVLLGAAAVLFIYPLWYLATRHRDVYSIAVLASLSPLLLLIIFRGRRALQNGRFAEFSAKAMGVVAFFLYLCVQVFWTILHIMLFSLLRSAESFPAGIIALVSATAIGAGFIPCLISLLSRTKLASRPLSVLYTVLFSLQAVYWVAVFVYHGFWLHTAGIVVGILGFFFLNKITKIRREKKSPDETAIHD